MGYSQAPGLPNVVLPFPDDKGNTTQPIPHHLPPSHANHLLIVLHQNGSSIFPFNTGKTHKATNANTTALNSPYLQYWSITGTDKAILQWMPLN